jgi:sulfatase maturation enzyme AslB (radical SAM superfamily)
LISDNKVWCRRPFVDIDTNGEVARPCCVFIPKTIISIKNYFQNKEIQEVRKEILNGSVPDQCQTCVTSENLFGKSFRTNSNKFDNLIKDSIQIDNTNIENLLISSSNVCNLKCIHCNGNSSYSRGREMYKLQLINLPPKKRIVSLDYLYELNFQKVTLSSGEPFYDPATINFLRTLPSVKNTKHIDLDINTNLTNISEDFLKFLASNYKSLQIKGSIDGVGLANDYLRYPSKWKQIEQAIHTIKSVPNIELCLTTSVSNLSLLTMPKLIEWGINNGIRNQYFTLVSNPKEMSPNLLPDNLKKELLLEFINLKNTIDIAYNNRTLELLNLCIDICQDQLTHLDLTPLFDYLIKHDQIRGTSFLLAFPKLKKIV